MIVHDIQRERRRLRRAYRLVSGLYVLGLAAFGAWLIWHSLA